MNERDHAHVETLVEELHFIERTLVNKDRDTFLSDEVLQHAVTMSLITIGECANRLSDEFKHRYSQIEWIKIVATRNIAAHAYGQLNMEQIWQAVQVDIPMLKKTLGAI